MGYTLYSTWDSRGSASRAQTAAAYASLKREGLRTAFYAPAAYLWQNTAAIYDIPSDSSNYMVFTESVPFMQMVLKGYVEYYDGFSNFHADRRKELLKMAEYGEYPSWIATGEDSLELLDTASSWLYTSQYDAWREEIAAEYETLSKALNGVLNAHFVRRDEMAKDVYRVRYDNGVEIWVNYSGTAYESGGVRVEALDFAVRQAQ